MTLIDTNVILRYLLNDIPEQAKQSEEVIKNGAFTLPEVIAEVVYVLFKLYKVPREEIKGIVSPLAAKDFVTPEDLKNEPLILPSRNAVKNELSSWFGKLYKDLNVVRTSNLSGNKFVMVRHGNGSAFVIENEVASSRESEQVLEKPLSPALEANSVLVWKRNIPYSAATKQFIEFVRN